MQLGVVTVDCQRLELVREILLQIVLRLPVQPDAAHDYILE